MTGKFSEKIIIKDGFIMSVGSIFFGAVIPNATGLIQNSTSDISFLIFSYLYFIASAFFIWFGNRWILIFLQDKVDWLNNPFKKVFYLVTSNIIYTSAVLILFISVWYALILGESIVWQKIHFNILICVICVFFITHIYETFFLIKARETGMLKEEQLERSKIQAELEALKNQIDPHFMFNSLNNLTHLIDVSPPIAKQYVENLADVYRYILRNKDNKLVLLEDEILFLNRYFSLLSLRYSANLNLGIKLTESDYSQYLIPPVSIMIAVENAVKHNEVSEENPLQLDIELNNDNLVISNKIIMKKSVRESSKIGLKNLAERYKIITGREINYNSDNGNFVLLLPMLKLNY
ncbi:MAG: sensor histidine kinase [Bacteroidetes bacterium]|nr:sensor histidine kinase [Bacteroidota bacterium]